MKIDIKATNIELTPTIQDYVNKRVGSLEKFIRPEDTGAQAWVEIGKTTMGQRKGDVFRAEIQFRLTVQDGDMRTEAEETDLYAAIDIARDDMKRVLSRAKDKRKSLIKRGARIIKKLVSFGGNE